MEMYIRIVGYCVVMGIIGSTLSTCFLRVFKIGLKVSFWFNNKDFMCLKRCETARNSALLNTTCIKLNTTVL